MNCKSVQAMLSAYLDRELPGHQMLEMRSHITYCRDCREEEKDIQDLKMLLTGMPMHQPRHGFEQQLVANLANGNRSERTAPRFAAPLFAGIAAAAMALTLLALSNKRPHSISPSLATADASDYAIRRDQAFASGSDPLGGTPVYPVFNERH